MHDLLHRIIICLVLGSFVLSATSCSDNSLKVQKKNDSEPAVQAKLSNNYAVIWTSEIKLQALSDIPKILASKTITHVTYIKAQSKPVIANTCNEYFKLTKEGYEPADNSQIVAESFFKKSCNPLIYLLHAKPAKISYIRSFNLQKDYSLLPVSIIFPDLEGDNLDMDLKTAYPDTTIKNNGLSSSRYSIDLISNDAGREAIVSILGWGDFNKKGYDEMLVFVANNSIDGTYHDYETYLVTRTSRNGPIRFPTYFPED